MSIIRMPKKTKATTERDRLKIADLQAQLDLSRQENVELKAKLDQFRAGKAGQRISALEIENATLVAVLTSIGIVSKITLDDRK